MGRGIKINNDLLNKHLVDSKSLGYLVDDIYPIIDEIINRNIYELWLNNKNKKLMFISVHSKIENVFEDFESGDALVWINNIVKNEIKYQSDILNEKFLLNFEVKIKHINSNEVLHNKLQ